MAGSLFPCSFVHFELRTGKGSSSNHLAFFPRHHFQVPLFSLLPSSFSHPLIAKLPSHAHLELAACLLAFPPTDVLRTVVFIQSSPPPSSPPPPPPPPSLLFLSLSLLFIVNSSSECLLCWRVRERDWFSPIIHYSPSSQFKSHSPISIILRTRSLFFLRLLFVRTLNSYPPRIDHNLFHDTSCRSTIDPSFFVDCRATCLPRYPYFFHLEHYLLLSSIR